MLIAIAAKRYLARLWRDQRGDTLVEVSIALAILAMVLSSSAVVAARAAKLAQTAKERTMVSDVAQVHMEAIRAFRDNHTWNEFLNGGTGAISYGGVLGTSISCQKDSPCFHMELIAASAVAKEYLPKSGSTTATVPTSYIEVKPTPGPGAIPEYVDFSLNYGFKGVNGGPDNINHIKTRISNLKFDLTAPVAPLAGPLSGNGSVAVTTCPVVGACISNSGAFVPLPGGAYRFKKTFFNKSITSGISISSCLWEFTNPGQATITDSTKCQPGDSLSIVFPTPPGLPPYPDACTDTYPSGAPTGRATWAGSLTAFFSDGTSRAFSFNARVPGCPRLP